MADGASCSPPKGQRVKSHWRAAARKKRRLFRPGETYYVAEDEHHDTCGHHHKTRHGAMTCARSLNRKERKAGHSKRATFISEERIAK